MGMIAVATAAQPTTGSFVGGTKDLTEVANWLTAHIGALSAEETARVCLPGQRPDRHRLKTADARCVHHFVR
jgi:hypothetical protein